MFSDSVLFEKSGCLPTMCILMLEKSGCLPTMYILMFDTEIGMFTDNVHLDV